MTKYFFKSSLNFCTRGGDLSNILRNQSRICRLGEQWPITFATMASTAGANLFFAGANLYVDQTALQKRKISWLCLKCRIMVSFSFFLELLRVLKISWVAGHQLFKFALLSSSHRTSAILQLFKNQGLVMK